ncbi:MAG: 5'-3' exonuclease H3TH domain-containing protein [Candidatus Paceibacterales bacterium]
MANKKRLILIDSNSIIHRAYHALPPLTTKKGELVNAIYGFLLVFLKAIKEFQPDFIVACFDFPAPTFRHKKFKEYKAKRPPAPKELYRQIPKVKEVLSAFNVPIFEKEGFEADDIIGTISKKFPQKQIFPQVETIIISGDLDTLQLVDNNTKAYLLRRGVKNTILYDKKSTKERYSGLNPAQLVDFRALKGDPSDNIPGVTGIGEKTAINLLKEFGTIENLYQELKKKGKGLKKVKPKLKELLLQQKEQAFLSKELAKIQKNVLINLNPKKYQWKKYDKEKIAKLLKKFEFYSLLKRLPEPGQEDEKTTRELRLW